jgi:hypothetical protein
MEGRELTARERGQVRPVAQARDDGARHIIHTATHGKGIRSRVQLGKRGSKHHIWTGAAKAAALTIDESPEC